MDAINTTKIVLGIITVFISVFCTYIELKKNHEYILNKLFAGFMILVSLGFLSYTIYHLIFDNVNAVIALNIISNVFYNYAFACLGVTPLIVIYSEKNIIVKKIAYVIFIVATLTLLGYFIWPVSVDMEKYAQRSVSSSSPLPHMIILTTYKLLIIIFVLVQYLKVARNSEGATKQKMRYFSWAMIIIVIGMIIVTMSSAFGANADYAKIIAGLFLPAASILITQALVSKQQKYT